MSLFGQEKSLQALQALLVAGTTDGSAGDPVVGTGSALDDQVTVRFTDGQVSEVELGPRAKRAEDTVLSTAIRDATNAAIEDYLAQRTEHATQPDFALLLTQLDQVSAEATASMDRAMGGLDVAMRRVQEQATRPTR